MEETDENYVPEDILTEAEEAAMQILLEKSRDAYHKEYKMFEWMNSRKIKSSLVCHILKCRFFYKDLKIVQQKIPCQLNVPYGSAPREKYDIYGTNLRDEAKILVHIHGGYYQESSITHSNNGVIANGFYRKGIKTILLGYELSPQRTVGEILENLKTGLRDIIIYAKRLNSRGVYLSGHSVGAHAIAAILTDFRKCIKIGERDLIKGVFLLAGLYDLEPITKMSANDILNLSQETARDELSPMYDVQDYGKTKIFIFVGQYDSPAFVKQSEQFFRKLLSYNVCVKFQIIFKHDHFQIVENLYKPQSAITKKIVRIIRQTA